MIAGGRAGQCSLRSRLHVRTTDGDSGLRRGKISRRAEHLQAVDRRQHHGFVQG